MKKTLIILLVCVIGCFSLFAANNQKIYSVDDDIYTDISNIYVLTGHALPSTTGPWSAAELLAMMDKISVDELPEAVKSVYQSVLDELNEEPEYQWKGIGATFTNNFNLQFAVHTNNDSEYIREDISTSTTGLYEQLFVGRDNWASDYAHNLYPTYGLEWETYVQEHIYADFEFGLYNSYNGNNENDFGTGKVTSNIFLFQNFKLEAGFMDANFPYRGFFSVGSDHWNFELGRDKLSWGAGQTGNLTISNNLLYHNMARFTAFSDNYKYTFLASFFPHSQNYYSNGYANGYYNFLTGQDGYDGISMYMAHRIEGRFFNDKLNVVLTEAVMYESATNHIDLVSFSPMYIFHNAYTPDIANSTLALEFDITPIKGLNVYGQVLVDEFAIPGIETGASADEKNTPNRYGFLGGVTFVTAFKGGVLKLNGEYARIDPYTYLKNNVDYVVPVRIWSTAIPGTAWNEYFMGYTYGCDSSVISLGADYSKGLFDFTFGILNVSKGTHDQWTKIPDNDTGGNGEEAWKSDSSTCTTREEWGSKRYQYTKDAVENTLDISLGASYKILDSLTIYGELDFVTVKNAFNLKDQNDNDVQLIVGAKYSL